MDQHPVPSTANPWVPRTQVQEAVAPVEQPPSYARLGPLRPLAAHIPQPRSGGLPVWTPDRSDVPWWWVGCHGGAGVSTLQAAVGAGADADRRGWPVFPGSGAATVVVLVARTHVRGLTAAQEAATQWASGVLPGVELLGLVAVADAPGKPPKALRDALRFVAGGIPRVWHVPWVEAWRTAVPHGPPMRSIALLAADLDRLLARPREDR